MCAVGAAAALSFGLTACGGDSDGPSKEAVVSAVDKELAKEAGFKEVPEKTRKSYVDCTADVMIKYADKDDLQAFTDGDKKADDVMAKDKDNKEMEKDATACAEKVAG
ncbi:hypothetical protein LHJ74_22930 [Streptomyces sp. N2-109]|uniref:Lipoprotein n=1 Tax=Streptomyces gossypii TaxID=2883101 RepID=A0ABT2JXV5_9ACTN|nr:hypothetical protein [Streptomyces gossypii]MCT2592732.1 hypothetical protein [Streptomyces gossypii]